MSLIEDIAEAVKDALNGSNLLGSAEAERVYVPEHELEDMTSLRVVVMAMGQETAALSRTMQQRDIRIGVYVGKKLDGPGQEIAELDGLMDLVEKIDEFAKTIEPLPGVSWVRTENDPIYVPDSVKGDRLFESLISIYFRAATT